MLSSYTINLHIVLFLSEIDNFGSGNIYNDIIAYIVSGIMGEGLHC